MINVTATDSEPAASKESEFVKTPVANLVRARSSGKLFARIRVKGKLIRKSLKTDSMTVAKMRLADLERREREQAAHATAFAAGKMTFSDALAIYRTRFQADVSLKPRTKEHKEERIKALLRTWSSLATSDVRKITKSDCINWASTWQTSAINLTKTVQVLRQIFEIAIEAGVRYDNPAKFIKTPKVRRKPLMLPSRAQFHTIIASIRKHNKRYSNKAADLVEFLAYSGCRISEARLVTWGDCDFDTSKPKILVRGDPITGTKNWEVREVPMIPPMIKLLERFKAARPNAKPQDSVVEVSYCLGSLRKACETLGIPVMTHHDLRHLYITTCVESDVPYGTIAEWAGHKDGGKLIMQVYGHLRNEHSFEKAKQVQF